MSRTKLVKRAYYWIGQALDKYADGPFDACQTRAILFYNMTRTAERRASRISALQAQARRAAQPGYANPAPTYFEAALAGTSIHAASCGTGASWSAHHAKAPTATLARTFQGPRVRDPQPTPKPRIQAPRAPAWPTRHVTPRDFSASQALFDEDLQAQRDFDALMLEVSHPTTRMKKFVRFSQSSPKGTQTIPYITLTHARPRPLPILRENQAPRRTPRPFVVVDMRDPKQQHAQARDRLVAVVKLRREWNAHLPPAQRAYVLVDRFPDMDALDRALVRAETIS